MQRELSVIASLLAALERGQAEEEELLYSEHSIACVIPDVINLLFQRIQGPSSGKEKPVTLLQIPRDTVASRLAALPPAATAEELRHDELLTKLLRRICDAPSFSSNIPSGRVFERLVPLLSRWLSDGTSAAVRGPLGDARQAFLVLHEGVRCFPEVLRAPGLRKDLRRVVAALQDVVEDSKMISDMSLEAAVVAEYIRCVIGGAGL
jgi:hypothetical protein